MLNQSALKDKTKLDYKQIAFILYFCGLNAHKTGSRFDSGFCAVTFVVLMAFELVSVFKNNGKLLISNAFIFYLVFLFYYTLSVVWTKSVSDTLSFTTYFVQVFGLVFMLNNNILHNHGAEKYLKYILWSLIYMVIVLIIKTPMFSWGSERVGASIGLNANDLGLRCVIGMLLALFLQKKHPIMYKAVLLLFLIISLFSGSRKALGMAIMGIFIYYALKNRGLKSLLNIGIAAIVSLILLYLVLNDSVLYELMGWRIMTILNKYTIFGNIKSIGYVRSTYSLEERQYAMKMFYQKPLLGWGGDGFRTQMSAIGYSHVTYSHCNYTELLSTLGIVGFLLYYIFEFAILIKSFIQFRRDGNTMYLMAFTIILVNIFAEFFYVSYYSPFVQSIIVIMYLLNLKSKRYETGEEVCTVHEKTWESIL